METIQIEVPEGKKAILKDNLLYFVDGGDIKDRIKTFEDALRYRNIDQKQWYKERYNLNQNQLAFAKLAVITHVLNEGWEPIFKEGEMRWYPNFHYNRKFGFLYSHSDYTNGEHLAPIGNNLTFKNQELSEYAGKQFTSIYNAYLYW